MIGIFKPDQISARSGRTSAIAEFVSIGAWADAGEVELGVERVGAQPRHGERHHRGPQRVADVRRSTWPSTVPGFHATRSASFASSAWPKVSAATATPVAIIATSMTPGIARTAASLRIACGVPSTVGGRHTIVGRAPGTSRSSVNFFWPVTIARASTRGVGVPMSVNAEAGLSFTSVCDTDSAAAAVDSEPYDAELAGRADHDAALDGEVGGRHVPLPRRREDQPLARHRRRPPDGEVRGADRGGAAGELVPHQLGPGIGQEHFDLWQRV